MSDHKPHVNKRKKQEVEKLKKLFQEYPVVAIADLEHLPAANLQKIKKKLRGKAEFIITKRRRIVIALNEIKDKLPNAEELLGKIQGMVALLFSKEDPFQLYKIIHKNISPAAARAGQESPEDITIPAGPTQFMAGPMIGELGQLGLKTEVKEGKIAIKEDKVIVKQGQIISAKVAELLTKFGIEPMKIGLNVMCTYQKGEILGKEILGVSEEEYIGFIQTAYKEALNLAVFVAYPSKETIDILVQKAAREGKSVADTIKFDESKPGIEKKEEAAKKEESPAPAPEEKKEQQKEAPKEEQKVAHPQKEAKKEEHIPKPKKEVHKMEEQPQEQQAPAPVKEEKVHTPQPAPKEKKTDEQVAQEVLKRLQDEKMQKAAQEAHKPRQPSPSMQQQEKDLGKIINKLKDKQNPGKKK